MVAPSAIIQDKKIVKPVVTASPRNKPSNPVQADAYRRAEEIYKTHKAAIDKLAEL